MRAAIGTIAAVAMLALGPAAVAANAEPLRGQWHLEDPVCRLAPCVFPDSSGNGLTATSGSTAPLTVPGRFGAAQRMPTKPAFIAAGNQPLLKPDKVTVVAWVRAGSIPGTVESVVSQGAAAGCDHASYSLYTGGSQEASGVRFYIWNGSTTFVTPAAPNTIWDGNWHMVAGTFNGSNVRLYVDGRQVGTAPASGSIGYGLSANDNFTIGNYSDSAACIEQTQFAGDVDEVRVYSRALSATEIGRMAAAAGPSPPDLVPDAPAGPPPPPSSPPPTAPSGPGAPKAAAVRGGISKQLTGAVSLSGATSLPRPGAKLTDFHWTIQGADKKLDFGCGADASTMSHPFRKAGDYTVSLTVSDTLGGKATTTIPLKVAATQIVPKLKDPYVFDCENPAAGNQPGRPGCVKSFGFGIVDVNSRGREEDCFQITPRINPGVLAPGARASQIEQISPDVLRVYSATVRGPVAINGLYLSVPRSVRTKYDSYDQTIALDGADKISLQLGPFPTKDIPLSLKVTPDKKGVFHVINVDKSANAPKVLGGLPIRGALSIDLIRHASKVKVGLGLPSIFSFQGGKTANGDAYLISDNVHGFQFDGVGLSIPEVFVGPLFVSNLSFKYRKSENLWEGGAKVALPGSTVSVDASAPPPDFGFGLKNGKFDHAGYGVEFGIGTRPDLFPPFRLLLTHIGASLGVDPLRLTGTIGISSGDVVDEDGVLFGAFASKGTPYEFPDDVGEELAPLAGRTLDSFSLAVGGTASLHVPVLGVLPLLHSYGLYEFPDYFEFGGGFSFGISFLQVDGDLKGFALPSQGLFNLEGGVKGCLWGVEIGYKFVSVKVSPCLSVGAVVSSKGLGFCGIVPVPFPVFGTIPVTVGAGYHWGDSTPDVALFTCDYSQYREASPKAAQAGGPEGVTLPAGLAAAMIRVRGDGGAPSVTVTDPKGRDVAGSGDTLVLRTGNDTTLVALRKPAAGRWRIAAKPGSPRITSVASANALPKLAVKAKVGKRGRRRVLDYTITGAAGRRVTFAERGARTVRILGAAAKRKGMIAFTPGAGRAGRRKIVALVEGRSGPARPITVASYSAPAPALPGRPAALRVARRKGTIRATWKTVPGVKRYEVLVTLRDGTKAFRVVRRTSLRLADPYAGKRGTLSLDALAADGTRGKAATIRLSPARRRR